MGTSGSPVDMNQCGSEHVVWDNRSTRTQDFRSGGVHTRGISPRQYYALVQHNLPSDTRTTVCVNKTRQDSLVAQQASSQPPSPIGRPLGECASLRLYILCLCL